MAEPRKGHEGSHDLAAAAAADTNEPVVVLEGTLGLGEDMNTTELTHLHTTDAAEAVEGKHVPLPVEDRPVAAEDKCGPSAVRERMGEDLKGAEEDTSLYYVQVPTP